MNKFKEAEDLKQSYKAALRGIKRKDIKELFNELFQKYPEFRAIGWCQYVPSFNDGDPCKFTMDTDFQVLTNAGIKEFLDDVGEKNQTMTDDEIHELAVRDFGWSELDPQMEQDISDAFSLISSDISERVFGADVQIIITRTKITTSSYNH